MSARARVLLIIPRQRIGCLRLRFRAWQVEHRALHQARRPKLPKLHACGPRLSARSLA
jgi:hypothetical protein